MKKFTAKIYIILIVFLILTFAACSVGYVYFSNDYLSARAGESIENTVDTIVSELNLKIMGDYESFGYLVEKTKLDGNTSKEEINEHITDNIDLYNNLSGFKFDIINSDNEIQFIDGTKYKFIESKLSNKLFLTRKYLLFKYEDEFAYVDLESYIKPRIQNLGSMENYYMIFDKNGSIIYQEDTETNKNKIFLDYLYSGTVDESTDEINSEIAKGINNYQILKFDGEKSFVVYHKIWNNYSNEGLMLSYAVEYSQAVGDIGYLVTLFLILFVALFLVLNIFAWSFIAFIVNREQYVSLKAMSYYYSKAYAMKVKKSGQIVSMNKICKVKLMNPEKYQNVSELTIVNDDRNIVDVVRYQEGLTVKMQNVKNEDVYIHFIPFKLFGLYCLVGEDVTLEIIENTKNREIALFNKVTGLPNRYSLTKALDALFINNDIRKNKNALVNIEVADFAKINKSFGYHLADTMLIEVSKVLKELCEEYNATIFNVRASYFSVLFRELKDFAQITQWSKDALAKFAENIRINEELTIPVDMRFGIYNIEIEKETEGVDSNKIFENADSALERAKGSRLIKCSVYNSDVGKLLTRDQIMEEDLKLAIQKREFVMFFQPQFNTKLNRIVGLEALVRWDNPKYKLESVEHFISLAEKNGMIIEIGKIIIEETFKFVKKIEGSGIVVSMNVSPVQLLQTGFVNDLTSMFKEYNLQKNSVAIEITETFLMENSDVVIEKLVLLKEFGFDIHLDDFGVGYSSMLYLKDLPIDAIKIDKEFTKHILNDKFSKAIVTKIVQLALSLDLKIIAEGVEVDKQSQFLSRIGCDVIQGYLISKGVDEEKIMEIIHKYNGGSK